MAVDQPVKKLYAQAHDRKPIVCPHCGQMKTIQIADYRHLVGKPLKVKCPCGHGFRLQIELRAYQRQATRLPGQYVALRRGTPPGVERGRMEVEDLSRTGLRLCTLRPHTLQVDETIRVCFRLDDGARTLVDRSAVVKWVKGAQVGVAFPDWQLYNETNRTVTLYLLPR
jgi:hypothetical protein